MSFGEVKNREFVLFPFNTPQLCCMKISVGSEDIVLHPDPSHTHTPLTDAELLLLFTLISEAFPAGFFV